VTTKYYQQEFKEFIDLQNEVRDSIRTGDFKTVRDALGEIECLWLHTDWPRLREAAASFLRRHAEYGEFYTFTHYA